MHTTPAKNPLQPRTRLVSRGAATPIKTIGRHREPIRDLYPSLLASRWTTVAASVFFLYVTVNMVFALGYLAIGDAIENARPDNFFDAFFFSVQTLATIGYGKLSPQGLWGNLLVAFEAFCGFSFYAMLTGLVFAKFSLPRARVVFSDTAIVNTHNRVPHFMLRLANERINRIVNAEIKLVLLRRETNEEGETMRRFYDMKLRRSRVPLLQLTWLVMHAIDEKSPLFGMSIDDMRKDDIEIIVSITGLDETMSQTIHARHSYIADEIMFGGQFEDIIIRGDDGSLTIRFDRFNDLRKKESA